MKRIILTLITLFVATISFTFAQTSINITESTFKIDAFDEEVFYYGLAEGDQLIFNVEEVNGRKLKEVEIIELPASSKFMDYKTKKINNKTLNITKTGVYKFRFANSAISGRVCKLKIQRIPAKESLRNFNTNVYWRTVFDTTYTTQQEEGLIKTDTIISNITDQIAKVHSIANRNGNKTTFNFTLPQHTVAWSYYIGVNQAGQKVFENATKLLSKTAGHLISKIPGYGPMAALALDGVSYLSQLQSGEDIDFYIIGNDYVNLFLAGKDFKYIKKGKVINDYSKMTSPLSGMYHVCLLNDNAITGVSVTVKITAIIVNNQYGVRPVQKIHLSPRQEAYLRN